MRKKLRLELIGLMALDLKRLLALTLQSLKGQQSRLLWSGSRLVIPMHSMLSSAGTSTKYIDGRSVS
jgi:hypothetical protein